MTTTDLSTQTPVEIDTQIAALYTARYRQQDIEAQMWDFIANEVSIIRDFRDARRHRRNASKAEVRAFLSEHEEISESREMQREAYGLHADMARAAWDHYLKALDAGARADEILFEIEPLNAEWERRGRWTRAFLVDNTNGHVHSSMYCSTCFVTTRFRWMVDYSGKSEAEIVEAAGERACTVCYPSAPVEVLSRPTQMFTEDEEAKAKAREEREAKKAEKEAAQVTVKGFVEYSGSTPKDKVFKTERAVTNAIAGILNDLCWYGEGHPSAPTWMENLGQCRAALLAKGADYDYDKALANARKKVTREGGTPKF